MNLTLEIANPREANPRDDPRHVFGEDGGSIGRYDRPGISGGDAHVAQYSTPIGTTMYRLICIAPTGLIDKHRPIFAHVAASFAPAKGGR